MKKKILCILSLFLILFNLFISVPITVFASDIEYTSVIQDLSHDESFDIKDYPVDEDNYSLKIVEIAESTDNELIIYIYNPSLMLDVDRIFLSYSNDLDINDLDYKVYDLKDINYESTLEKYIVKDFIIPKEDKTRIYNISMLQRKFNSFIDDHEFNTINYVSCNVELKWIFNEDSNGNIFVDKEGIETIEIKNKYGGRIRYLEGWYLAKQAIDSHYIAFSTDYKIDNLLEASVSFDYTEVTRFGHLFTHDIIDTKDYFLWGYEVLQKEPKNNERLWAFIEDGKEEKRKNNNIKILSNKDIFVGGEGLFIENYEYARIQSVNDFLKYEQMEKLTQFDDDLVNSIKTKQWVLRYYESNYLYNEAKIVGENPLYWEEMYTHITNLSVLELRFEIDGVTYTLPTIDNSIETEDKPDNENWFDEGFDVLPDNLDDNIPPDLSGFFTLVLTILFLCLVISLIGLFLPVFTTCINFLLLPFKLINKAFKNKK